MLSFLRHLFIPHGKNNHRAKILHNSSLFILAAILFTSAYFIHLAKTSYPDVLGVSYSISENDLLTLVNKNRTDNGLSPLTQNAQLDDAARRKAADMLAKNYWAHFAPDGSTSPWGFIRAAGYNYQFAGENLAKGFTDASSIVTAWMNSPSHRENILSKNYQDVGFAIVPGSLQGEDTVLVVEEFGEISGGNAAVIPPAEAVAPKSAVVANPAPVVKTANVPSVKSVEKTNSVPVKLQNSPKIDISITSRAILTVGLSFLVFGFLMDMAIVERKKIPRIVGHNLDHIMLILMFILFVVLMKGGVVI